MEKIVRKFVSFWEVDNADYDYYRTLSGNEKLQLLLDLIMPENPDAATVERSARVHPLAKRNRVKNLIVGAPAHAVQRCKRAGSGLDRWTGVNKRVALRSSARCGQRLFCHLWKFDRCKHGCGIEITVRLWLIFVNNPQHVVRLCPCIRQCAVNFAYN
jgi:hypothetical protein